MSVVSRHRSPWPLVAAAFAAFAAGPPAGGAEPTGVVVLVERGPPVADIAVPANGQSVFCLDADSGGVVAIDPGGPGQPRPVIGAAPADGPRPQAIACIDTNTLAAVCRADGRWSLRTWRLRPDGAVEFAAPLQEVGLGEAAASPGQVHLLVGQARDWLAVAGLPAPLSPLVRAPIARASVGRSSAHGCPAPPEGTTVVAVTASPGDETALFLARHAGAAVSFHGLSGRTLLELDSDLPLVRDAACCRSDGTLWAVGGDRAAQERPEGLWRIDAAFAGGRQVVRPVCVARLAAPHAVACVTDSAVVVAHGDEGRTVIRYDLAARKTPAGEEKGP
jgi:hypothetical protein